MNNCSTQFFLYECREVEIERYPNSQRDWHTWPTLLISQKKTNSSEKKENKRTTKKETKAPINSSNSFWFNSCTEKLSVRNTKSLDFLGPHDANEAFNLFTIYVSFFYCKRKMYITHKLGYESRDFVIISLFLWVWLKYFFCPYCLIKNHYKLRTLYLI